MKKSVMILISILFLLTVSTIASAQYAKPGSIVPLQLQNYEVITDTPLLPDWKPTHIKWMLKSPSGEVKYFVDDPIDSVTKCSDAPFGKAKWRVSENSGTMKIPAFAEAGQWTLSAMFYNQIFGFSFQKTSHKLYSVRVEEDIVSSFNAPFYVILGGGFLFSFAFATPDLIFMIAMFVIAIIVILNLGLILKKRRKNVKTA